MRMEIEDPKDVLYLLSNKKQAYFCIVCGEPVPTSEKFYRTCFKHADMFIHAVPGTNDIEEFARKERNALKTK
jgi:hypothetical protein